MAEETKQPEPIDLKKAVKAPFTALYWIKTTMFMLGMCFILLVGYAVYKAFIKKPDPAQHQFITVQPGANATFTTNMNDKKKRLETFVEPYVFAEAGGDSRAGIGVKGGIRW